MSYALPEKNIYKYSSKFSFAVSAITFLASFMNEENWFMVGYRVGSIYILFTLVMCLNFFLLKRFCASRSRMHLVESVEGKRIFSLGLILTYILVLAFHFLNNYLIEINILPKAFVRQELERYGNGVYFIYFVTAFVIYFMVSFLHNFIILQDWRVQVDLENSKLKTIHADTVNELLKQQIQPHFLFNALNVLKSLIRKHPEKAEEYLISLSDFLRASVNQNRKTVAPLAEELKICADYMEMQKIRFGEAVDFCIDIEQDTYSDSDLLPVFSLQPLVENAIKHNELTRSYPLIIRIAKEGDWVEVKNTIRPKSSYVESNGNGLSNLQERYKILSGDSIDIHESSTEFSVKIKVLRQESLNTSVH